MSSALSKDELKRFLSSDIPEVLCLRGKWGVGKTFALRECLKEAAQAEKIALERYAYVSLFFGRCEYALPKRGFDVDAHQKAAQYVYGHLPYEYCERAHDFNKNPRKSVQSASSALPSLKHYVLI